MYRARWKATAADIAKRGGEIIEPGEIRTDYYGRGFHPFPLMTHDELVRATEPQPDMRPEPDERERWLATVFLRRYVTWCTRIGRKRQAMAAGGLWQHLSRVA